MQAHRGAIALSVLSLLACGGPTEPKAREEPAPTVVTVTVYNRLDLPVSLSAGGTVYGTLGAGASNALTLPPRTSSLTWANSKRRYGDGTPITDDLSSITVSIAANQNVIDVTNVADGVTYFTPSITKAFSDTIALEVARGTSTICLGYVWGQPLFGVRWGYYALTSDTQLRYYKGSTCKAGAEAYRFWNATAISSGLTIGSGVVNLRADVLP